MKHDYFIYFQTFNSIFSKRTLQKCMRGGGVRGLGPPSIFKLWRPCQLSRQLLILVCVPFYGSLVSLSLYASLCNIAEELYVDFYLLATEHTALRWTFPPLSYPFFRMGTIRYSIRKAERKNDIQCLLILMDSFNHLGFDDKFQTFHCQ